MPSPQRNRDLPLYVQVRDDLRREIESAHLAAGTRLPSSRQLAADLGVSRMTVLTAYAELEADGLIGARPGGGTYVLPLWQGAAAASAPLARPAQTPAWQHRLDGGPGLNRLNLLGDAMRTPGADRSIAFAWSRGDPSFFPGAEFRKAMAEVLRSEGAAALGYEAMDGYPLLKQLLSHYLLRQGIQAAPENILITAGAQQAIDLVARALVEPGDRVVAECPTYPGALDAFERAGADLVGVALDQEGMHLDQLERVLQEAPPRLIYTVPTFHNPTGTVMSAVRRRDLLTLAHRAGVPLLEDEYLREVRFGAPIPPPLAAFDQRGDVIHVGSFSKSLTPALRLGYVVARGPLYERLVALKGTADVCSSPLLQRTLYRLLESGLVVSHWKRTSRVYKRRQAAMLAALRRHFPPGCSWSAVEGGLLLWLRLPPQVSPAALQQEARGAGITFGLGAAFFPEPADQPFMRLNFAAIPEPDIDRGLRVLGNLVREQVRTNEQHRRQPADRVSA